MTVARAPCRPARGAPGRPAHRPDRARLARGPRARLDTFRGTAECSEASRGLEAKEAAEVRRRGGGRGWLVTYCIENDFGAVERLRAHCAARVLPSFDLRPKPIPKTPALHISHRASHGMSHRVATPFIMFCRRLPSTSTASSATDMGNKQGARRWTPLLSAYVHVRKPASRPIPDVHVLTPSV